MLVLQRDDVELRRHRRRRARVAPAGRPRRYMCRPVSRLSTAPCSAVPAAASAAATRRSRASAPRGRRGARPRRPARLCKKRRRRAAAPSGPRRASPPKRRRTRRPSRGPAGRAALIPEARPGTLFPRAAPRAARAARRAARPAHRPRPRVLEGPPRPPVWKNKRHASDRHRRDTLLISTRAAAATASSISAS